MKNQAWVIVVAGLVVLSQISFGRQYEVSLPTPPPSLDVLHWEASHPPAESYTTEVSGSFGGIADPGQRSGLELNEGLEDKDDPAYKTYKEGYNQILDENWEEAGKMLAEVIAKYPKSDYVDDASYWSAYALKHLDEKKGIAAYKEFLKRFPTSKYYDDAVADLNDLGLSFVVTTGDNGNVSVARSDGNSISYRIASSMRKAERQLKRAGRQMQRQPHLPHLPVLTPVGMPLSATAPEDGIDPDTRLKMDALYALGDTREDSISFRALRDVALDRNQPQPLRDAALDALSNLKKFDILSVYLEIAKQDTSETMQNAAIDYIGQLSGNKNRNVETLIELFSAIPDYRAEQLQTILNSVAEIGNDKAIDFLEKTARTHANYDLRSDAIYLLGNIGGEKARSALYKIIRGK